MSWNHRILAHENNGEVYFQNSTEGGMSSNVKAFTMCGYLKNVSPTF